nr:nanos homolog 1 [Misgurnus anguillicaudatus]
MNTMQSNRDAEKTAIPSPDGCFLMWHDYMDLHKTLSDLFNRKDTGQTCADDEGLKNLRPRRLDSGSVGNISSSASSSSASSYRDQRDKCGFCKHNGEAVEVYTSHRLKSKDGKIVCPVLRTYVCPVCSATGDWAHTRQHCPFRSASLHPHINGL